MYELNRILIWELKQEIFILGITPLHGWAEFERIGRQIREKEKIILDLTNGSSND